MNWVYVHRRRNTKQIKTRNGYFRRVVVTIRLFRPIPFKERDCAFLNLWTYRKTSRKTNSILIWIISICQQITDYELYLSKKKSYLSLTIISKPWTSKPLSICGPIPLNKAKGPSYSTTWDITSIKVQKGFPRRTGGGCDCRPTFATIKGWVRIVASALERAPKATAISKRIFSWSDEVSIYGIFRIG